MSSITTVTIIGEEETSIPYPLLSVEVNHQINKISYAKLIYKDANGYIGKFEISKNKAFQPGKSIKINLRYEATASEDKTIFEGIIVRHKIKVNKSSLLILELKDLSINLTTSRRNVIFINKTDQEIFKEIAEKYSNNVKFNFNPNFIKHNQMVQAWCSDWDFILSRIESNGWWLIAKNNQLEIINPLELIESNSKIILELNAGSQIYAFDMSMDILDQVDEVIGKSWNIDEQKVKTSISAVKTSISALKQLGDFKKSKDQESYTLYHSGNLNEKEREIWAHSKQVKNNFSLLNGKLKVVGRLDIELGMIVKLNNLGIYFSKEYIVSSVKHIVDNNGFHTEIGVGMSSDNLISMKNVEAPSAGGILPPIKGLHIGIVEEYENNGENALLVKVNLPMFDCVEEGGNKIWARLTSIYAGNERGIVFKPEIGDEVVLGFFNDDPRYPVILGSMYSAKNKPPEAFNNNQKAIITKANVQILIDDNKNILTLGTFNNGETNGINIAQNIVKIGQNINSEEFYGVNCISKNTEIKANEVTIKATKVEVTETK